MTSTSKIITTIRGLLPDLTDTLKYAQALRGPIDPVVNAYLRDHVGLWRLRCAGQTDIGPVRSHNEDDLFLCPEDRAFAVFDGMGGSVSGLIATQCAIAHLAARFPRGVQLRTARPPLDQGNCPMVAAIEGASQAICDLVQSNSRNRGIGGTVAGLFFDGFTASVTHVGDSRVYLHRYERLTRLTEDHSLLNKYLKLHKMSQEEQDAFPHKKVITRSLGFEDHAEVTHSLHPAQTGDIFLLCTDGLSDGLREERMEEILNASRGAPLAQTCEHLVRAAIDGGTTDNITVVLVELL